MQSVHLQPCMHKLLEESDLRTPLKLQKCGVSEVLALLDESRALSRFYAVAISWF